MKSTLLPFTLVLLLFSCAVESNDPDVVLQLFDLNTFNTQRQLWLDQDLQNYSFYIRCASHMGNSWSGTAVVKNGVLESFLFYTVKGDGQLYVYPDDIVPYSWMPEFCVPVSGIYDSIARIRNEVEGFAKENNDPAHTYYYSVEVEYDNEYHFPRFFSKSFSYNHKDPNVFLAGNGSTSNITITNFIINPELNVLIFDRETFYAQRQLWQEQGLRDYSYRISISWYMKPMMDEFAQTWEGTVVIKDGNVASITAEDTSTVTRNGIDELFLYSFSAIYSRILYYSQKNYGLDWGCQSQATLEVEYDDEFHFPNRFHYHAEPVEPASVERLEIHDIVITDFILN